MLFRYFDPDTVGLDFKGMMEDITNAPSGSIILLHGERNTSSSMSQVRVHPACHLLMVSP